MMHRQHPQNGSGKKCAGMALAAIGLLMLGLTSGCNRNYLEGQSLEAQKRWEEAAIAYHLALVDDPDEAEYQQALTRVNQVVARENFERYRNYVANKSFRKAYRRLMDAARQDPDYAPVRAEMAKWERVLVSGQVMLRFETALSGLTLADEVKLIVRINTPNPGKTIDAEVDIGTGYFFAEDLLYDRPKEMLAYYSIHSVGASLVYGRTRIKKFTSKEYQQFVRFRTPIIDQIGGTMSFNGRATAKLVREHRKNLTSSEQGEAGRPASLNPHYSIRFRGNRILVSSKGTRPDFTPRYLYLNRRDRRVFVDFGRYEARFEAGRRRWLFRRLPLGEQDYFETFSRNIALQPYFFYREGVYVFEAADS